MTQDNTTPVAVPGRWKRHLANAARTRLGIASVAVFGPLLAVGAVAAATGDSPVEGPSDIVEAVATSVGIGGHSGDVRMDENRAEASKDWGQPGSWPGNTANAPGLNGGSDDDGEDSAVSAAEEGETPTANEGETPTPDDGEGDVADEKAKPHENGHGCDDVLFGMGEPPFASPGGPVGCEVGNSGEHRQNGAKATETPTPDDGVEDEATPDASEDEDEDDSNGGTSRGLGRGHDEDRPGNGNANGHDKHDHDPNPNGRGPGGGEDDGDTGGDDGGEETPTTSAAPADTTPVPGGSTGGPGNSNRGNGNGRNR